MIKTSCCKAERLDFNWILRAALPAVLISLFMLSQALAAEQSGSDPRTGQQPTRQVTASPSTPSIPVQETRPVQDSTEFLIGGSPLSRPEAGSGISSTPTASVAQPEPATAVTTQTAITPEVIAPGNQIPESVKPLAENPENVAMLVSENCGKSGDDASGSVSCNRVYSNGHHATVLTQRAIEGDESKQQTVIEEYDSQGDLLYRKTIRRRLDYNYLNDQKAKEKELFDIIYQPTGKKTTRELMVYEYFLDTGKTRSLSWTQYKQIGNESRAGLTYHALLRYADDGSPDRALAEKWDNGKKTETFMNWSRRSKGYATLDDESWNQWEGWIRNVAMQAYLP